MGYSQRIATTGRNNLDVDEVLTDLSASDIPASINWETGARIEAKIGDLVEDGGPPEYGYFDSMGEALAWLLTKAVERFPNTEFARKHKQG